MAFVRDEALIAQLRRLPVNVAVLDAVESTSAHGDLGEVVFRYAKRCGDMRVVPLRSEVYPAIVATPVDGDVVVVAASGMHALLMRTGDAPERPRLPHELVPELGEGWWRVRPWIAEVSAEDAAVELTRWFSAAERYGRGERGQAVT